MAVWTPVTVVPTSLATVAIDTFMTELSRVMRNWPAARVSRTVDVPCTAVPAGAREPTSGAPAVRLRLQPAAGLGVGRPRLLGDLRPAQAQRPDRVDQDRRDHRLHDRL